MVRHLAERGKHARGRHGQFANANADGVIDSVGNGSAGGHGSGLTDAARVSGATRDVMLDKVRLDLRSLLAAGDLVLLQVWVDHDAGVAIEFAVFKQRERHALDDAAIDLAFETQQVDRPAAIVNSEHLVDFDYAGFGIHRDFRELDTTDTHHL